MDPEKKKKLEAAGYNVGSAADFIGLSQEKQAVIDIKIALSRFLKEARTAHALTQTDLAERCGSSQPRVAAMENGDPSASVELLMRAILATGATRQDIAFAIGKALTEDHQPTGRLMVYILPSLHAQLQEAAKKNDVSVSAYCGSLLHQGVGDPASLTRLLNVTVAQGTVDQVRPFDGFSPVRPNNVGPSGRAKELVASFREVLV